MSISIRLSIAWSGRQPGEDSDILVLTGHKYFVDVRVKKDTSPPVLDWAFAGTRTSVPHGNRKRESLCTWHHLIDSRSSEPVSDDGIVFPDPSDPTRTIEQGRMLNPATGKIESHEEIWIDEELPNGTRVVFLEKEDGSAFVGMIGNKKLGVGRGFAWRTEDNNVVYSFGPIEGIDLEVSGKEKAGERLEGWVLREVWQT